MGRVSLLARKRRGIRNDADESLFNVCIKHGGDFEMWREYVGDLADNGWHEPSAYDHTERMIKAGGSFCVFVQYGAGREIIGRCAGPVNHSGSSHAVAFGERQHYSARWVALAHDEPRTPTITAIDKAASDRSVAVLIGPDGLVDYTERKGDT